ncbi:MULTISPECIES: hypothetical protein [Deinococcus]|uniref:HD hydrolase, fragament n=1 Tax=Deinococcus geothermalis (strain DSM 11300 / CIP 105573 / AG-3a) TaxID=319795 RepID=Q1IWG0_DEIGD|nr:HD hydrolase, fragament [Deinococcus geothermalis DSM 11300]
MVDGFDALTHARSYRAALSVPEALALIDAETGGHFAPGVVQSFLGLFPRPEADDAVTQGQGSSKTCPMRISYRSVGDARPAVGEYAARDEFGGLPRSAR